MIKKITFISPRDVRKNRSDAVHIMRSCEAYSNNGIEVNLVTPQVSRKENPTYKQEIFSLYNINPDLFDLTELNTKLEENDVGNTPFLQTILNKFIYSFIFFVKNRHIFKSKNHLIVSKCFISTVPIIICKKLKIISSPILFELITVKNSILHRFVIKNVDFLLSSSHFVRYYLIRQLNRSPEKIISPPMITQVEEYNKVITINKDEARKQLNINANSQIVMYAGKVAIGSKELDYIYNVALKLSDVQFYIVGASQRAMTHFESRFGKCKNIAILPFQTIPNYYRLVKAADILLGYYTKTTHHMYQLSPGKMGIYMASKNPVILSDLPSLRLRFQENMVYFVEPDSPDLLSDSIVNILSNYKLASDQAIDTYEKIKLCTYRNYAHHILKSISDQLQ